MANAKSNARIKATVYLGMVDGKKKYKYFYGKTKREATKKAAQYSIELEKGINLLEDDTSFGTMGTAWLEDKVVEVSYGRHQSYKYALKKLEPLFDQDVKKIRTADLQKLVNEWAVQNPNTGRPSSRDTLNEMKMTASQVFQFAINNRLLDYNPAKAIKLPKNDTPSSKRALTKDEQQWIIDTPHRAQPIAMTMLFAGLRRGEAIPLTWRDFDVEKKCLCINKSVAMVSGKFEVKPHTKNGKDRVVYIPDVLFRFLQNEKKQTNSIYMFPSAQNGMMTDSGFRRLWSSYLTELNIKYATLHSNVKRPTSKHAPQKFPMLISNIRPHWLRHTYATMLYMAGVDVLTARDQLGHSDIETTLQIYTHLDESHKSRTLLKLNDYLDVECMQ